MVHGHLQDFRYYQDNWITEGIAGVDNPTYPMIGPKTHGSKKAAKLDSSCYKWKQLV